MLVHQSSTRRKSCAACVKAKRRCDLRLPSCSRCQKRKLNCSFARVWEEKIAEEIFPVTTSRRKGKEVARISSSQNQSSLDASFGINNTTTSDAFHFENMVTNPEDFAFGNFDFEGLPSLDQFIDNFHGIPTFDHASFPQPYPEMNMRDIAFSTYPNNDMFVPHWGNSMGMSLPPSLQTDMRIDIGQPQLEYEVKHFQSCIQSLVNRGHAPFIHDIFNDNCPLGTVWSKAVFRDLLGICSLQTNRTHRNSSAINAIMNSKVNSLIESSPKERPFLDLLASLQALIVYQIIRLFGSDAEQRSIAERQMAYMLSWTKTLQTLSTTPITHRIPTPISPWQEYIVSESVRRTILTSILLKGCYSTLKNGACADVRTLSRLPVSDRGSFWRLREQEWEEKLRGEGVGVRLFDYQGWVKEWCEGRLRDVDDFGEALLVCCVGVKGVGLGGLDVERCGFAQEMV